MSELFSNAATDDEIAELTTVYALDEKKVRRWDRVKVSVMLDAHRRQDTITRRRAERVAAGQEEEPVTVPRGQPSHLERVVAADFLEQSLAGPVDDLAASLLYVSHAFTDDEVRSVAAHLITVLRAGSAEHFAAYRGRGANGLRDRDHERWEPDPSPIPD